MTREEILNMPAGPIMNLLVSESVMQWKLWLEQRGEYKYCVLQKPGEREPWYRSRDWQKEKERYSPMFASEYDPHKHIMAFLPDWSIDIAAAWEVHQVVVHKIFSKRKRYFDELQRVVSSEYTESGKSLIAYPDVFIFVKPSHFCRAALLAAMEAE